MKRILQAVAGFTLMISVTTIQTNAQAFTENFDNITTLPGSGWFQQNNSTTIGTTNWFQGNAAVFNAYNGATTAYIGANFNNTTAANTISNWLVMPNVTIKNGDVISFWTRKTAPDTYPDRLELRMSTNGASTNVGPLGNAGAVGDFTTLLTSVNPALVTGIYPLVWTQYSVTISGLGAPISGRFALRYYVTNGGPAGANSDYIGIDNVVYTPYVCPTLTITPASLPNGNTGVAYSQNLSQTGALGTPSYSVISGSLPTGLSLSAGGAITGTPSAVGTFNFTVQVSDASGCTGSQAYTITITCPSLSITPASIPNPTVGTAYNTTLNGSGGSGPYTFTVTGGSLPTGLSLSAGGTISGIPTTAGPFSFTVTATDAYGCQTSIGYSGTTSCPALVLSPATLNAMNTGVFFNQTITTSGGTAPYTYTVTGGSLPTGLTLNPSGTLSGIPTVTGPYSFTVTSFDAYGCSNSIVYSGTVTCPGMTLSPASMPAGSIGSPFSQTITTSGGTAPYTYVVSSGSLPPGLTLSSGGNLTGTPTTAGSYGFNVTSTDAYGCTVVTAYVIVIGCPSITLTPPTLPNGNSSVAYNQSMSSSGGTAPYSYSVTSGSLPPGLTLTTGGVLSGIPNTLGVFNFDITTTDQGGCAHTTSYSITISCATNFVTLTPFFTTLCSNEGLFALSGGTPAGGTYSGTGVSGSNFNPAVGTQSITYSYTDGAGCADNDAQTITVNSPPTVNLNSSDLAPCLTDGPVTLTGGPSGGTYFGSIALTGNMFNPNTAGVGSHPVFYSFTDVATGCTDTATVTIVVNGCAGIEGTLDGNVQVYPNPAEEMMSISFMNITETGNWTFEIYAVDGKIFSKKEIIVSTANHIEPVNVANLSAGSYFIKIQNTKGEFTIKRFVKK